MDAPGIGDRVYWKAINRTLSGIVEDVCDKNYTVRLGSGRCVIVHITSIRKMERK